MTKARIVVFTLAGIAFLVVSWVLMKNSSPVEKNGGTYKGAMLVTSVAFKQNNDRECV
ncbi:hypothetical protein LJC27_07890 [Christensenellaceae bacterium OttesenSCG-928-M15]|nr:hypothetical protein [Christensenellaceae bacterium OttesenSCG-928-M15]